MIQLKNAEYASLIQERDVLRATLENVRNLLNSMQGHNYVERSIAQEAADDIGKLLERAV